MQDGPFFVYLSTALENRCRGRWKRRRRWAKGSNRRFSREKKREAVGGDEQRGGGEGRVEERARTGAVVVVTGK